MAALPADGHGLATGYSIARTIAPAQRMQPAAGRIVVVSGSEIFDRGWEERARRDLAGLTVDFVTGLTPAGFQKAAAGLDRDTIILILIIYQDAAGLHSAWPTQRGLSPSVRRRRSGRSTTLSSGAVRLGRGAALLRHRLDDGRAGARAREG